MKDEATIVCFQINDKSELLSVRTKFKRYRAERNEQYI